MAKRVSKKRTPAKTVSKRRVKKKPPTLGELESSMEKMALTNFAENARKQLKNLGDKLHEATDRGVHMAKEIAEEVQHYAKDKTELTRLKIELHSLKAERDKLYSLMGEQLRNLYKAKQLSNIRKRFKADFQRLDDLEAAIEENEKISRQLS